MTFLRRFIFALTSMVLLAGCSDLGAPFKPQPRSQLSVTSLDFGTVVVSRSSTRAVTITNVGTGTLTGNAGLSCSEYTIQSGGGGYALGAGESQTVVVAFAPGSAGTFPCTLELGTNVSSVPLAGTAALQAPGARCVVLQDSISFGSLRVGQTRLATFEVISAGTAPLLVDIVPSCSEFQVLIGGGPAELPIGVSTTVTVAFSPTAGGATSCTVEVGPDCPVVKVVGFGTSVSFATDIKPMLTSRCASCHDFANPGDPRMYDRLVTDYTGSVLGYIKPLDLANSWIYQKIISPPGFGERMPQGGPYFTAPEIDKVHRWILEGALEN